MKTGFTPWVTPPLIALVLVAILEGSDPQLWSRGTAFVLPPGQVENGLLQPLRYGQSERWEWATYPLVNLLVPNMAVKMAHGQVHGWRLASRYSIHYPTPLLRLLRRPGIGGLISPEKDIAEIAHILALRGELLASRNLKRNMLLTVRAGAGLAAKSGDLDQRATIDLPLVFPRMAFYRSGYQLLFGLNLQADLPGRWAGLTGMNFNLIPGADEPFALELGNWFIWQRSPTFRVLFGYILTFANYPFGSHWQWMPFPLAFKKVPTRLVLPLIDFQWTRQRGRR